MGFVGASKQGWHCTRMCPLHSTTVAHPRVAATPLPADEAVDKFGRHGEKAQYGDPKVFKEGVTGEHFPGLPTTDANAVVGHAGGGKSRP